MDKKILKYVGILVGAVLGIILILIIFNSLTGNKKYTYDQMEEKLISAAKKYVSNKKKNNIDILPDSPLADPYYLSINILVNEDYISDNTLKDGSTCVGGVNIYNAGNGNYDYIPELTCGTNTIVKLSDKILEDNDFGTVSGSGLYQRVNGKFVTNTQDLVGGSSDSVTYLFRGDEVNNYLKIDDNLWRIVEIDENNNLLIIFNSTLQKSWAWDDKYNEDVNKYHGVNIYESNGLESNAYKVVQEFYQEKLPLLNKEKYSVKTKYLTVPMDLCVGKRSTTDSDASGAIECKTVLNDQNVGLLPAYYFMSISLDTSCNNILSKNCGNFNYLTDFNDYWWLLTANSENTMEAYSVAKKYVQSNNCSYKSSIRPIIKLGSRAVYKDGNGTKEKPYEVKFYD